MSMIASFFRMAVADLPGLRIASVANKTGSCDLFWEYIRAHGEHLRDFAGPGFVFGAALPYLKEEHGVDLMRSSYDDLRNFLSAARQAASFFLTDEHRAAFSRRLDQVAFETERLNVYYNQFNETKERNAGDAMKSAVDMLRTALAETNEDTVIFVHIG